MTHRALTLLTALALAGCVSAPPSGLRIEGRLVGPAAGSLDAPADWVVELRPSQGERVLTEQRGTVSPGQPPIPFVLTLPAAGPGEVRRYTLRAAVRAQGQVHWLSEPLPVETAATRLDLGAVPLQPYTHPGGFASTLDCGGQRVTIGFLGDKMRVTHGTAVIDLEAVRGSRPSRFERAGEPSTFVQTEGHSAVVSLQGRLLPPCSAAPLR
jgi:Type III secretion system lipoprotein chaperone (YscW)